MKKEHRVCKNRQFTHIIKKGKKISNSEFSLFYIKNQDDNYRIGISVSKKISKLAVVRNRVRRQIVAILESEFDRTQSIDMIILPKSNILNLSFEEIKISLVNCLSRLGGQKDGFKKQ